MQQGLVHIYCGDGKGKTTCSIGLGVRMCGVGKRVYLLHFLKSNNCSEHTALANIANFKFETVCETVKFIFNMNDLEKNDLKKTNETKFSQVVDEISKSYDLIILDEILGCIECGVLDEQLLLDFIKNKPTGLELVITGRNPSKALIELADYVSEIKKIKHPFDKGINARKGIEM